MKRIATFLAGLAATTALLASPASAATEFGSDCAASTFAPGYTVAGLGHGAGSPLPVTAPVSGVVTRWRTSSSVEVPPEALPLLAQRLLVFRPTGLPNQLTLVGEAAGGAPIVGVNSFPARLPISAGDYIGLGGQFVSLICGTADPTDVTGLFKGNAAVGQTIDFEPGPGIQVPVVAVIEPDVDGDGYGDETQDGCPQSAAYQTPCPVVTIDASSFGPGRRSLTVFVTASMSAVVKVSGTVALGKGGKVSFAAKPATVGPAQIKRVKLSFPTKLKQRLGELPPGKKLSLKVKASAANVAGAASTDKLSVKLKGQG